MTNESCMADLREARHRVYREPQRSALCAAAKTLGLQAATLSGVGLNKLFGRRTNGSFGILMYHRLAANVPGIPNPSFNVTPGQFHRQISGLLDRGFSVWPLEKVIEVAARSGKIPPRTVVITFDDGFAAVYTQALPILRALQVPATVFLSTAYLDSPAPFPFDVWGLRYRSQVPLESYRPMSTTECRQLAKDPLMQLGVHTHTHQDFRGRVDALREDLQVSVDILRRRFAVQQVPFAFPYGDTRLSFVSEPLIAAAKKTGVSCALSTDARLIDPETDPFHWGRFNVFPWDTATTLQAKLEGWYSWAPRLWHETSRTLKSLRGSRFLRPVRSTA